MQGMTAPPPLLSFPFVFLLYDWSEGGVLHVVGNSVASEVIVLTYPSSSKCWKTLHKFVGTLPTVLPAISFTFWDDVLQSFFRNIFRVCYKSHSQTGLRVLFYCLRVLFYCFRPNFKVFANAKNSTPKPVCMCAGECECITLAILKCPGVTQSCNSAQFRSGISSVIA